MSKCLILAKIVKTEEKHNTGLWFLVDKSEEEQIIQTLGDRFIFSFELDESKDEPLLKSF